MKLRRVVLNLHPRIFELLEQRASTGMWPPTIAGVAEELLRMKLRELEKLHFSVESTPGASPPAHHNCRSTMVPVRKIETLPNGHTVNPADYLLGSLAMAGAREVDAQILAHLTKPKKKRKRTRGRR